MYKPLITIVTVSFNAKNELALTYESVVSQDYLNIQYIVVDGGSSDGTVEFLKEKSGEKVEWLSEPDDGIYDAMNKSISMANGEWVIFMNAGDEFYDAGTLSSIVGRIQPEADFVYGDRYRQETDGTIEYQRAGDLSQTLLREVVYHQSLLNKTSRLKGRPYDKHYSLAADYEYVVNAWSSGAIFQYVPIAFCTFKCGGKSRQQHIKAMIEAIKISIDYQPDLGKWRDSDIFKSFIWNHIEFALGKELQDYIANNRRRALHLYESENGGASLKSSPTDKKLDQYFNRIFRAISHPSLNLKFFKSKENINRVYPKVSIVTVVFNDCKGFKKTLESIKGLTYPNFEYLVVDGGSDDGTLIEINDNPSVIDAYISERDGGIYPAMNKAIDMATGDYVIFMNSGDAFSDVDVMDKVFDSLENFPDVIYGDRNYVKLSGEVVHQQAKDINTVYNRMPYCHQSAFVKLSVLLRNRFNETFKYAADYHQVISMYEQGLTFEKVSVTISDFMEGGRSESGVRPYIEAIKVQLDSKIDKEKIKDSAYLKAFLNNINNFSWEG